VGVGAGAGTAGVVGRHLTDDGVSGTGGSHGVNGTGPIGVRGVGIASSASTNTPGGVGVIAIGGHGVPTSFTGPHPAAGAGLVATGGNGKIGESAGGDGVVATGGNAGGRGVVATGVVGVDATGTGDRGGIFRSANVAQLHLQPIFSQRPVSARPINPFDLSSIAQAGDLVALSEATELGGTVTASLWFCTVSPKPATPTTPATPATWIKLT
jgi:hypothetical protein